MRDKPLKSAGAVSGWIRQQNSVGIVPSIDSKHSTLLRMMRKPPFTVRAERYLTSAAQRCKKLDDEFKPDTPELIGASYGDDVAEAVILRKYLEEEGFISSRQAGSTYRISARGYMACDELAAKRAASTQAFVAMWFAPEMNGAYDSGIKPAIEAAGYSPMIIRGKEHVNKIDDEIIAEIRRSAFLVADFTGHRGGVYFEAGFAMGLGLPVIWSCKAEDIGELHFDIRQYNCIDWTEPVDLARRLQKRIEALLGQGPRVS
jgi:hypothetical protein